MKVDNILSDIVNITFVIFLTFFTCIIVDKFCTQLNITKYTLIFTLLINNFILVNCSQFGSIDNFENILIIMFINIIILITCKPM
jgi:hypothetical protein